MRRSIDRDYDGSQDGVLIRTGDFSGFVCNKKGGSRS